MTRLTSRQPNEPLTALIASSGEFERICRSSYPHLTERDKQRLAAEAFGPGYLGRSEDNPLHEALPPELQAILDAIRAARGPQVDPLQAALGTARALSWWDAATEAKCLAQGAAVDLWAKYLTDEPTAKKRLLSCLSHLRIGPRDRTEEHKRTAAAQKAQRLATKDDRIAACTAELHALSARERELHASLEALLATLTGLDAKQCYFRDPVAREQYQALNAEVVAIQARQRSVRASFKAISKIGVGG